MQDSTRKPQAQDLNGGDIHPCHWTVFNSKKTNFKSLQKYMYIVTYFTCNILEIIADVYSFNHIKYIISPK